MNIVSSCDFAELRARGGVYVDKTGFIEKFLGDPTGAENYGPDSEGIFLTCPGGFGKTLLLTTLASFFDITKDSRALFADLKVAANTRLCERWMNRCPVLLLSLKNVAGSGFDGALRAFAREIGTLCERLEPTIDTRTIDPSFVSRFNDLKSRGASETHLRFSLDTLARILYWNYGRPVLFLIDDCDVPVLKACENGYLDRMTDFMRSFLSITLDNSSEHVLCSVVTGCVRTGVEPDNLTYLDMRECAAPDGFGFTPWRSGPAARRARP